MNDEVQRALPRDAPTFHRRQASHYRALAGAATTFERKGVCWSKPRNTNTWPKSTANHMCICDHLPRSPPTTSRQSGLAWMNCMRNVNGTAPGRRAVRQSTALHIASASRSHRHAPARRATPTRAPRELKALTLR